MQSEQLTLHMAARERCMLIAFFRIGSVDDNGGICFQTTIGIKHAKGRSCWSLIIRLRRLSAQDYCISDKGGASSNSLRTCVRNGEQHMPGMVFA